MLHLLHSMHLHTVGQLGFIRLQLSGPESIYVTTASV